MWVIASREIGNSTLPIQWQAEIGQFHGITRGFWMTSRFSLRSRPDVQWGKVNPRQSRLSELLVAQQEAQTRLSALKELQRDLSEQLKDAQASEIDLRTVRFLRMNLLQVNNHIEGISLELARINHALGG